MRTAPAGCRAAQRAALPERLRAGAAAVGRCATLAAAGNPRAAREQLRGGGAATLRVDLLATADARAAEAAVEELQALDVALRAEQRAEGGDGEGGGDEGASCMAQALVARIEALADAAEVAAA